MVQTSTGSIVVTNTAPSSTAVIQSESYTLPTGVTITNNTCLTTESILTFNQTCTVSFQAGPQTLTVSNLSSIFPFQVNYIPQGNSGHQTVESGTVEYNILAQDTMLIITGITASSSFSGSNTSGSPYTMNGLESATTNPYIRITYKNVSVNYGMDQLSLQTATISPLWSIDPSSTCGYGTTYTSLASQGTCVLQLNLNRNYVYASASNPPATTTLDFNYPNASWRESGSNTQPGIVQQSNIQDTNGSSQSYVRYVNTVVTSVLTPGATIVHDGTLGITQTIVPTPPYSIVSSISSLNTFNTPTILAGTGCLANGDGSVDCTFSPTASTRVVTYQFNVPTTGGWLPIIAPVIFTTTLPAPATLGFSPFFAVLNMSS